jgi:uncharacterized membrane protein YiaA
MDKDAMLGFLVGFLFVTAFLWMAGMDFSERGIYLASWFLLSTLCGGICASGNVRRFCSDGMKGRSIG